MYLFNTTLCFYYFHYVSEELKKEAKQLKKEIRESKKRSEQRKTDVAPELEEIKKEGRNWEMRPLYKTVKTAFSYLYINIISGH